MSDENSIQRDTIDGDWVLVSANDSREEAASQGVSAVTQVEPQEGDMEQGPAEKSTSEDMNFDLSSASDWPTLSSLKGNDNKICKRVPLRRMKKVPNKRKMKIRKVPQSELGFHISVLSHKQMFVGKEVEDLDVQMELAFFEESLKKSTEGVCQSAELETACGKIKDEKVIEKEKVREKNDSHDSKVPSSKLLKSDIATNKKRNAKKCLFELEEDLVEETTQLAHFELYRWSGVSQFEGSLPLGIRLRRKHKWRRQKAHKASKTKHLDMKNIKNRPHGHALYISARLYNEDLLVKLSQERSCNLYRHLRKSIKGFPTLKELKGALCESPNYNSPIVVNRPRPAGPRNAPALRHAVVNAYNADAALEADLVNALIAIQDRDLTPEDYELLLRLDERVKPKTVAVDIIDALETSVVTENDMVTGDNELCSVCIEPYVVGQKRKHLPCGHIFHCKCIDNWLNFSSQNCPLDGLPLEQQ